MKPYHWKIPLLGFLPLFFLIWNTSFAESPDITEYKYHRAILKILKRGEKVHLGIIVDKVVNALSDVGMKDWKEGMTQYCYNNVQTSILDHSDFNDYPGFVLVDRANVEATLKELNFQQTGYMSEKDRAKIGEFLGLTHILFCSLSRFESSAPYDMCDEVNMRLVEARTGKMLAVDTVATYHTPNSQEWTDWKFKFAE